MATNENGAGGAKSAQLDEAAILDEGRRARCELGIATARAALADPRGLDPRRLRRLGQDGMAAFMAELRGRLPASQRRNPALAPPSPPRQAKTTTAQPTAGKVKETSALDGVDGWWKRPAKPRFEKTAYRQGLIVGAFLILGLAYAFHRTGL